MNYADQLRHLAQSRALAVILAIPLFAIAFLCVRVAEPLSNSVLISFALTIAAIPISFWYSPDYLHLSVSPDICLRWEIRIRWRIAAIALVLGLILTFNQRGMLIVIASAAGLLCANLIARAAARPAAVPSYFLATDFALLAGLLFTARINILLGAALLAAAIHVSLVACEKHLPHWTIASAALGGFMILDASALHGVSPRVSIFAAGLVVISAFATAALVHHSCRQNVRNVESAMQEIAGFTACTANRIWELWSTSNRQLAEKWRAAALPENDRARVAAWYAENSELYLFAISAYNLDYRRIRANLKFLRYARGACLDYGAGNGEIILEVARRGLPAAYFDVDGATMKFAMSRVQHQRLAVNFTRTKEELSAAAQKRGFDTIFAFDVLEHIPDLRGEFDFLASLLAPGGLFVFDVPAGSTKSHPMHLNHHLDVHAYMRAKGLQDVRTLWQRLPFTEKGRFFYRRVS
jgi:SAM-dependent methyltransferase